MTTSETNNKAAIAMWRHVALTDEDHQRAGTKVTALRTWIRVSSPRNTRTIRPLRPAHRGFRDQPQEAILGRTSRRKPTLATRHRGSSCPLRQWSPRIARPTLPLQQADIPKQLDPPGQLKILNQPDPPNQLDTPNQPDTHNQLDPPRYLDTPNHHVRDMFLDPATKHPPGMMPDDIRRRWHMRVASTPRPMEFTSISIGNMKMNKAMTGTPSVLESNQRPCSLCWLSFWLRDPC